LMIIGLWGKIPERFTERLTFRFYEIQKTVWERKCRFSSSLVSGYVKIVQCECSLRYPFNILILERGKNWNQDEFSHFIVFNSEEDEYYICHWSMFMGLSNQDTSVYHFIVSNRD
jgi:hypothetical protein